MLRSRVIARFVYLECPFSEQCVAKLVYGVLLLYLVVSSALEHNLLVAARVRKSCNVLSCFSSIRINFMDLTLVSFKFSNDHG